MKMLEPQVGDSRRGELRGGEAVEGEDRASRRDPEEAPAECAQDEPPDRRADAMASLTRLATAVHVKC